MLQLLVPPAIGAVSHFGVPFYRDGRILVKSWSPVRICASRWLLLRRRRRVVVGCLLRRRVVVRLLLRSGLLL